MNDNRPRNRSISLELRTRPIAPTGCRRSSTYRIPPEPNRFEPATVRAAPFLAGRRRCNLGSARRSAARSPRPDNLARIAVEGEAMGYDYATISDHVVIPRDIEARYPYSDTGEFPGPFARRPPRAADCGRLCRRQDLAAAAGHLGHRRPAPPGRAARQDARHDRRAVEWPADLRDRRRLDERGIRGAGRAALSRAGRRHRRVSDRPAASCGPRTIRASQANTSNSPTCCSSPSRCRSRTRRSGSAAKAARRCAAPQSSATAGIRSAPIRSIGSIR